MSDDPAYYVTSNYYEPGTLTEAGTTFAAIAVLVAVFIAVVVGSRILLKRSRRLSPTTRKVLRALGALSKPAGALSFGRSRQHRLGSRRKTEQYYRMRPAAAGAAIASPASAIVPPRPIAERPSAAKRIRTDLSPLPDEAWPFYAEDEITAVADVLRSGKVNQWTGNKVIEFERAYTRHLRNGRAIALANGSLALELALLALEIGPGDEVIVTPRTFVASASCVRLVGATPVFADVDRKSGNITAESIERVITPRTKAVIPVHLAGWPADMPAIMELARRRQFYVVEDCAQAHGAEIDGLPVGSFGDAAAFSFCQDKIISTGGEGGLVSLRDDKAYEWAWSFKDHGKNRERALERSPGTSFRWLHDSIGTNWRMTEIEATIGLLQLDKLPQWRSRRTRNAETWANTLAPIPGLRVPQAARHLTDAYYKFYAYVDADPTENEGLRNRILEACAAAGIRAFSGSCSEVYREAAFSDMEVEPLPVARELGQSSLMFEVHPTLNPRRLQDRADAVAEIAREILS